MSPKLQHDMKEDNVNWTKPAENGSLQPEIRSRIAQRRPDPSNQRPSSLHVPPTPAPSDPKRPSLHPPSDLLHVIPISTSPHLLCFPARSDVASEAYIDLHLLHVTVVISRAPFSPYLIQPPPHDSSPQRRDDSHRRKDLNPQSPLPISEKGKPSTAPLRFQRKCDSD